MQFPGDRMEADHQPHFKLLDHLSALITGGTPTGKYLFDGLGLRKPGLYGRGYTIVLGKPRHKLGRTHGSKSHDAFDRAMLQVNKYTAEPNVAAQRAAVLKGLRWSMQEDVKAMRAVAARKETDADAWTDITVAGQARAKLVKAVRQQILEGLDRVAQQPLNDYGQ